MAQETFKEKLQWTLHKLKLFLLLMKACAIEACKQSVRGLWFLLRKSAMFVVSAVVFVGKSIVWLFKSIGKGLVWLFKSIARFWLMLNARQRIILSVSLLLIPAAVLFVSWFKSNSSGNEWHFRLHDRLIVATDYSALDYSIVNGAEQGFQYELVNAFASSLDMEVEWKLENDLAKSIDMLNNGDVDLIARPIPVTTEMREQVLFSKPILQTRKVLVQRKAEYNDSIEPIRDQLELAGKTIYVPSNSPDILRLKNLADEIADTIIIKEMPDYQAQQLLVMVAKGDIDYAVCDEKEAIEASESLPEIDYGTAVGFHQLHSWAIRKSNTDLCAKVDTFLTHYKPTKEYRRLYLKYYSSK
jgi:membrane-bound lytic murein transglycosylase MltF